METRIGDTSHPEPVEINIIEKIAIVVFELIPESAMQSNGTIATEIETELHRVILPYVKSVQKVSVLSNP